MKYMNDKKEVNILEEIKQWLCDQLNTTKDEVGEQKIISKCKSLKEKIKKILDSINL